MKLVIVKLKIKRKVLTLEKGINKNSHLTRKNRKESKHEIRKHSVVR